MGYSSPSGWGSVYMQNLAMLRGVFHSRDFGRRCSVRQELLQQMEMKTSMSRSTVELDRETLPVPGNTVKQKIYTLLILKKTDRVMLMHKYCRKSPTFIPPSSQPASKSYLMQHSKPDISVAGSRSQPVSLLPSLSLLSTLCLTCFNKVQAALQLENLWVERWHQPPRYNY